MSTRKNGIDLLRLIGAFFIMCIHTDHGSLQPDYVAVIRLLSRWAVPFYFIATGFFLGYKIENNTLDFKRIQKNVSMLISILIVSSIIYLPLDYLHNNSVNSIGNILTGSYFHLWFIGALLTGYIFIWYLFFLKKRKLLPFISAFLLLSALLTDSYDQVFDLDLDYALFSFLLGIPFMYLGIVLSKMDTKVISTKLLVSLVILGIAIQFIEAALFTKLFGYELYTHQFLIGTLVMAIPLFVLSSNVPLKDNKFSKWGEKHALLIYLYHPFMYEIMRVVLTKVAPDYFDTISIFSAGIGFSLMLLFSIFLSKKLPRSFDFLNGKI